MKVTSESASSKIFVPNNSNGVPVTHEYTKYPPHPRIIHNDMLIIKEIMMSNNRKIFVTIYCD